MKLAVYQGTGVQGDAAEALAVVRRIVTRAAARGVRVVVFPELFLCGYNAGDAVHALAEPAGGRSAEAIAALAARTGVAVLYGYPERDGRRVYNSAQLIDGSGRPVANYRKTHLYGRWEHRVFTPGDGFVTGALGGLTIGILICYDVEFPEAVRVLALAGADLIAVPTALIRPFDRVARTLVPSRAFENQVYVAYAGLCGEEGGLGYCGLSCVIGPDGSELARAGRRRGIFAAEIDPGVLAASRRLNSYLTDRRPRLYAPLAAGRRKSRRTS
jgi:5-aminopentanamidase